MNPVGEKMTSQTAPAPPASLSPAEAGVVLRYVARQPILDAAGRLYAYELLFRNGPETAFRGDVEVASRTMLDNTVVFGLDSLTGGYPAFFNCTLEVLTGSFVELLPPPLTVLEVLETVEPTPELIEACCRLKSRGYRIALDDFVWAPRFEPLIEIADYIKVDFLLSGPADRQSLLQRLRGKRIRLLAEKVETEQQFQQARAEGFTLFQGYYFCRPTLLSRRSVPANTVEYFHILQRLQEQPLDLKDLCPLIKRDAALTYRLLRLVNSPLYPHRDEIRSIRSAILTVGEVAFRHLATLVITSELAASSSGELIRMALVRARFCELAAAQLRLDPTEQYLLGMFSLLPAMLRTPAEEAVAMLPLRSGIREALVGCPTPERMALSWIEAFELADWPQCDALAARHGVPANHLQSTAEQAIAWAQSILQSVR